MAVSDLVDSHALHSLIAGVHDRSYPPLTSIGADKTTLSLDTSHGYQAQNARP